jgi:glyoxylase-like metal-dependent hydrolase (beta-lactamase superfamily II)
VLDRVDTIDGDMQVCDGVRVWHVGGHSPGLLAVAVDTSAGWVVVGGDFFNTYVNLEHNWPVGSLSSLAEWEESCRMLKSRADVIVPGHDYEVWKRHPTGTIG